MATQSKHLFTIEEYLGLERAADFKSEFHAGEIYGMAGGTETHSRLSTQIIATLLQHLTNCRVYDSNLRLFIEQFDQCVYPDGMALCAEEPQFHGNHRDVLLNPSLVVEVLSPSTEKYDQETKAQYYRSNPSLQHILLVRQDRIYVDHFARQQENVWIVTRYSNLNDAIQLLGSEISLKQIYGNILSA